MRKLFESKFKQKTNNIKFQILKIVKPSNSFIPNGDGELLAINLISKLTN